MYLLIIGIIFIIGGASGDMVLKGTESSAALAVVGGIMVVIGIIQLAAGAKRHQAQAGARRPVRPAPGDRRRASGRSRSPDGGRPSRPEMGSRPRRRNPADERPRVPDTRRAGMPGRSRSRVG